MASRSLGTLTIDLVAKTGGFIRGMDSAERASAKWKRQVKRELDDVTRAMKRLAVVGVAGLTAGFAGIVSASAKQEDALKQVEQRLKSTGGAAGKSSEAIQDLAKAMQQATTFGDEAVLEMQSMLLTFTDIRGEVYDRAVPAILDLSVAMNQDLKSSVVQLGKALNDPIANLSALSRTGIQFTEEQKDTIKTLVAMGEKTKAQGIILDELNKQFGGAAHAASETFSGALKQLQNAFGDLLENPAGLQANTEAIQDLVALLEDPETVSAAQEFTSAMIMGFRGAIESIRETIGMVQFLGEEMARIRFGAASDDIVRLEQELEKAADLRSKSSLNPERIRFFGPGGVVEYWSDEELDAEIQRLESAIASERDRLQQQFSGSSVMSPTPVATTIAPAMGIPTSEVAAAAPAISAPTTAANDPATGAASQSGSGRFSVIEEQHQEHADNIVAIEQEKNAMILASSQQLFGSLNSATSQFADKQSTAFKVMFALEKGAAIARSIVAIQAALAQAAASGPFPANLAAMATVAAQTASIISTISSATIQGQAHDGLMSVPTTGTYILEKGERVTTAETSAKMDRMIEDAKGGSGSVRIVNAFDSGEVVGGYLGSSDGERTVMNIVKRNQQTIRSLSA